MLSLNQAVGSKRILSHKALVGNGVARTAPNLVSRHHLQQTHQEVEGFGTSWFEFPALTRPTAEVHEQEENA